ncbi:MAG: AraC family transcriptional regulator [Terriglobales bacterium]
MVAVPQTVPGSQGERTHVIALAGISARAIDFPAGLSLDRHEHAQATLCYVFAGGVEEASDGRRAEFLPGALVLRPPHHVHATRFGGDGSSSLVIEFAPERLRALPELDSLERPVQVRTGAAAWLARQLLHELRQPDSATPLAAEGLCLALLAEAIRPREPRRAQPALRACEQYLAERFLQPIGLNQVAAEAGVHPAHLARVFRAVHGCTVGEYLRQLRLQWAAERMATTDLPLAEIALAAGFYDQSHFTNCFHRHLGQTPAHYRARKRPV